jgi:hypothetical protein
MLVTKTVRQRGTFKAELEAKGLQRIRSQIRRLFRSVDRRFELRKSNKALYYGHEYNSLQSQRFRNEYIRRTRSHGIESFHARDSHTGQNFHPDRNP